MWTAFAIEFIRQISSSQSRFQKFKSCITLNFRRFSWENRTVDLLRVLSIWFSFLLFTSAIIILFFSKGFQWSDSLSQGFFADSSSLWQNAFKWLLSLGGGASLLGLIISAMFKLKSIAGSPFDFDFNKYFKSPDYENRVAFIENFHNDFKNIVNAYAGDNKIFIFIDDLDRCDIPKAAELMQGLNLMISDNPHLVFIIGMDREKVAASFAVKHEKLLPYLSRNSNDQIKGLEYGYAFIEKFIQLPFSIPQPGKMEIQDFLKNVSTKYNQKEKKPHQTKIIIGKMFQKIKKQDSVDLSISKQLPQGEIKEETQREKTIKDEIQKSRERIRFEITGDSQTIQEIALMVAPALDNNPRRIKQFLNLFRLRTYIASATGLFDFREDYDKCLTLEQLGKFVAISLRWPLLLADLDANRQLLIELQDKALGKNANPLSDSAKYWGTQQKLLEILSSGCLNDDYSQNFDKEQKCSLSKLNLDKLLQVSPRVIRLKKDQNANINNSHDKADERINNPVNSSYDRGIYAEDEGNRQSLETIQKTHVQDHFYVPKPNPYFTGREDILEKLHNSLNSDKAATLAISGLGGIGKSQTAVEYAYIYRNEYNAVLWVEADSREAIISSYATLAEVLDLPEKYRKEQNFIVSAVLRWLEDNSRWLLVFDNADEPRLLEDYIPKDHKGHILLTSRAQLFDKLGISKQVQLEKMPPDEAKEFLLKRTGRSNLHQMENEAILKIAKELDYLPLALEQASAYILKVGCSFADYLSSRELGEVANLNNLASLYQNQGKYDASESLYKRVLEITEKALGSAHPDVASSLNNLASLYQNQGKYDASESLYKRVLEIREKALGSAHPDVASSLNNLASLYQAQGKYDASESLYKRALKIREKALGSAHPDVSTSMNNLALLYQHQGKYDASESLYKRALEISEKALGFDHPSVASNLNNLASLYQDEQKYAEAASLYHRAIEIAEKSLGEEHPDFLKYLENYENFLRQIRTKPRELAKIQKRLNRIENKKHKEKHK